MKYTTELIEVQNEDTVFSYSKLLAQNTLDETPT